MNTKIHGAIVAAALLAACAGQDGQDPTGGTESTSAAASSLDESVSRPGEAHRVYVIVQSEFDQCRPIASCGLAWVREVNRDGRPWLVMLDETSLGRTAVEQLAGAPDGSLVLRGVLGGDDRDRARIRPFAVLDAWRGMPDVEAPPESAFVRVEMPDGQLVARFLDSERWHPIASVSMSHAGLPFVSRDWLESRVLSHYALVAGTFDGKTLEANQVFVHLPDTVGPCPGLGIRCEPGTVATYERDANRCVIPTGCVPMGPCPMLIPACSAGYTRASWASQPNGCQAFACDPSFIDLR